MTHGTPICQGRRSARLRPARAPAAPRRRRRRARRGSRPRRWRTPPRRAATTSMPERLLARGRAQRREQADQPQQHVRHRERVGGGGDRGERLLSRAGRRCRRRAPFEVSFQANCATKPMKRMPMSPADAVRREHVERLVHAGPRAPDDHRVARQRGDRAEHHRPDRADVAGRRGDRRRSRR